MAPKYLFPPKIRPNRHGTCLATYVDRYSRDCQIKVKDLHRDPEDPQESNGTVAVVNLRTLPTKPPAIGLYQISRMLTTVDSHESPVGQPLLFVIASSWFKPVLADDDKRNLVHLGVKYRSLQRCRLLIHPWRSTVIGLASVST